MRVAVTGATGFIGRHVMHALAQRDCERVAVVRPGRAEAAAGLGCELVEADLQDAPADLFERMGRPDVLVHLAWSGLPNYRSLHHFERELPAQYRLLSSLVAAGLPSLFVAGTCFEYGMQSGCLSERLPALPDNPYGYAKDALRRQLQFLQASHPFDLVWARLFYLYGEGQAESSLLPQLRRAAAGGEALFRMSGGEQLRDYLAVAEAADRIARLATGAGDVGVVNLCSGVPVSVRTLVERWIAENGWSIRPAFGHYPYPDYEPMAFWGDATKLLSLLGEEK